MYYSNNKSWQITKEVFKEKTKPHKATPIEDPIKEKQYFKICQECCDHDGCHCASDPADGRRTAAG